MIKIIFPSLILTIVLFSCSKNPDSSTPPPPPPPPPPGEEEALRVMQSIFTRMVDNELVSDTTTYTYDDQGRGITKVSAQGQLTETWTYTGDKLTSLKSSGSGGETEILKEARYSANGDTILIDFIQNGGNTDTVQLTYVFDDEQHTDYWTYLHFTEACGCGTESQLQKQKWYYNAQGNVSKTTIQNPPNNEERDQFTVLEWDDKNNPKHGQPKLNALFQQVGLPLGSSSLHNPVKYTDGFTTYEVEMTYNSEGYPLTVKYKGNDYITTQLIYNR